MGPSPSAGPPWIDPAQERESPVAGQQMGELALLLDVVGFPGNKAPLECHAALCGQLRPSLLRVHCCSSSPPQKKLQLFRFLQFKQSESLAV